MQHPGFFQRVGPFTLDSIATHLGAEIAPGVDRALELHDVRPLDLATASDISFLDNKKYLPQLEATSAAACLVAPAFASRMPKSCAALLTPTPYVGFARVLKLFYPDAGFPKVAQCATGEVKDGCHASARLEAGVVIEPGAVIGREAQIGSGSVIAAGAVIGYRVTIGRDCYIGPGVSITNSLIGNRVIVHAGVRIGQDGFGFAMGPKGHLKVPQIGRVIIQDDVEIGANSTIDRGALKDTIIGEGCKIDNLVQIGHNVVMGRHCVIVAQSGIAGSVELGDFVVMGGQSGVVGHVKVGTGAQIAGSGKAKDDIPAGGRYGGIPAKPMMEWAREIAALKRLASRKN